MINFLETDLIDHRLIKKKKKNRDHYSTRCYFPSWAGKVTRVRVQIFVYSIDIFIHICLVTFNVDTTTYALFVEY